MHRDVFTPLAVAGPSPPARARGRVDPRTGAGRRPNVFCEDPMTWHRSPRDGRTARFAPRVEALEERCVPACNFIVRGGTLFVTAPTSPTAAPDTIVISDNGGNGANNVVGFCRAPFFPNVPISRVQVNTHGSERVVYNLVGDLTTARVVNAQLGGGDNSFQAVLRRNILTGGNLALNVAGGAGNDHLQAVMIGSLAANAHLAINYSGGGGNDTLNVISATLVNVAAGATLDVNLNGGGRSDHIFSDYEGQMNGEYSVNETGGRAASGLFADVEFAPGSTGRMGPSHFQGGPGNDKLTFIVHNQGRVIALNNTLDGGGGFNTCVRTTNVAGFRCARDRIVP
jgi:hypothetical protein